ncbi:MAG: response regulator transcription factor [bacterium]|nr:response regulator transcription factor [bacterium]
MNKFRILLIEDEPGLVLTLTDRLENEGYHVDSAVDGETGYCTALTGQHDLILLDIMLPGRNGLDLCRDLRAKNITIPILMLTARDLVTDKIVGLKLGADDYMTKPFEMLELLARIEALLRRIPELTNSVGDNYSFGDITFDFLKGEVFRNDQPVELSAREFALIRFFIENRGKILTREDLLIGVWGYDKAPFTRTVDVHVASLRTKLGDGGSGSDGFLVTVHGRGYKFKS